jgi:hypothetical protein
MYLKTKSYCYVFDTTLLDVTNASVFLEPSG